MSNYTPQVKRHLDLRRPSVNRIAVICQQALEHDHTWYEFKDIVERMLKHETKMLKMLEHTLNKHMEALE